MFSKLETYTDKLESRGFHLELAETIATIYFLCVLSTFTWPVGIYFDRITLNYLGATLLLTYQITGFSEVLLMWQK